MLLVLSSALEARASRLKKAESLDPNTWKESAQATLLAEGWMGATLELLQASERGEEALDEAFSALMDTEDRSAAYAAADQLVELCEAPLDGVARGWRLQFA